MFKNNGFKPCALYYVDGYKPGHKRMLAPGTATLYGTWIPRSLKYAPPGVTKIFSFGQQLTWAWLHDIYEENFFNQPEACALKFAKDMSLYLGLEYNGDHFVALHRLQYLPMKVKALPEGIETPPNIPHMTFINTVDGFAWLTLYLETIVSALAWKPATSGTIGLQYRRNAVEWVMKTDPDNAWLIDYLIHDFSARGLDPFSMLASGLGHATSFRGSDSIICIPGARYYYGESEDEVCINSVNASEHSVSTTKIFTVGERQMVIDWLKEFPVGILSIVADTFNIWELIGYLAEPEIKELILARDGKLVVRGDSGDPVDIICGVNSISTPYKDYEEYLTFCEKIDSDGKPVSEPAWKGVIELLWDIFGGITNNQGYKVLDKHIGAIYGDSITLDRQIQMYTRLEKKEFASTNIVLGVGSFTYQCNTRDTLGFAAKGSWFEIVEKCQEDLFDQGGPSIGDTVRVAYDIYKNPITDDGHKRSLKGRLAVLVDGKGEYYVKQQCTQEEENISILQEIYVDGKFPNLTTLREIRERRSKLCP